MPWLPFNRTPWIPFPPHQRAQNLGQPVLRSPGSPVCSGKDATVRVTYSADDFAAAGGDASQLKLSYYDAAQNAWVILSTQVDSSSTTLTATTNHLSVWAVMVSSSTTGGTAAEAAPEATTTKSPLPLTVILVAIIIAGIAFCKSGRK